jgi:hypothetical protein
LTEKFLKLATLSLTPGFSKLIRRPQDLALGSRTESTFPRIRERSQESAVVNMNEELFRLAGGANVDTNHDDLIENL